MTKPKAIRLGKSILAAFFVGFALGLFRTMSAFGFDPYIWGIGLVYLGVSWVLRSGMPSKPSLAENLAIVLGQAIALLGGFGAGWVGVMAAMLTIWPLGFT